MITFITHPPGYRPPPPPPRVTLDGITLKKGDIAWRSSHGYITRNNVTSQLLRHWSRFDDCMYSTETAAINAAIAWNVEKLKKAKQETRRAEKAIARLKARRAR